MIPKRTAIKENLYLREVTLEIGYVVIVEYNKLTSRCIVPTKELTRVKDLGIWTNDIYLLV